MNDMTEGNYTVMFERGLHSSLHPSLCSACLANKGQSADSPIDMYEKSGMTVSEL